MDSKGMGSTNIAEEFKYGFPSNGLSTISYRWCGNRSDDENGTDSKKSSTGGTEKSKQQNGNQVKTTADLPSTEASEATADLPSMEASEDKKEEKGADLSSMELTEDKNDEADAGLSSMEVAVEKIDEVDADVSTMQANEVKKDETNANPPWASSLRALRKRAAEDGKRALKLGVYRGYNMNSVDSSKELVLRQIFRLSFPSEWGHMITES